MNKAILLLTSVLALLFPSWCKGAEDCEGGVCSLPGTTNTPGEGLYQVLSPVGEGSIKPMAQAPRLDTLDGKTIAVVGGSFMAYVTHPEIKRLIQSTFPKAKVLLLNEIGSAGPWPAPGVVRREKDAFIAKLKQHGVQAVISGNGGCGLCTPKEMGSCIAAESIGIPSVMIAAPGFVEQARNAAITAGVAIPRVAEYPGAFSAHSRQELLENTRKVLWPQILSALTTPWTPQEKSQAASPPPYRDNAIVFSGTMDEVQRHFVDNGWSDGLPIIPPTPERVAQFLRFTDLSPDALIGAIPVAYRKATVRKVAVNGVMAGCPPEFMPILIAFTQAMMDGSFRRTLASTHAWTPYCWLNGPIARQLGIDCKQGEISSQRNAAIGRFINLAMLNLGGYYVKENRMGTFGYLMPWCMAEDEPAALAIGWRPWQMQQGYNLNDNTLTAASALSWGNNLSPATSVPEKIMELLAWDAVEKQQFALGSGTPFVYRTMLITEQVAQDLAQRYTSKEDLEKALVATARRPLAERAYANYWANPGSAQDPNTNPLTRHQEKIARNEGATTTATPPWLSWTGITSLPTVPVMQPGKSAILITGDANRNKTMCVPGGGFATIKITLPKKWDELMAQLGYQPLDSFKLDSTLRPATPSPNRQQRSPNRGNGNSPGANGERRQRQPGYRNGQRPQGANQGGGYQRGNSPTPRKRTPGNGNGEEGRPRRQP